MQNRSMHSQRNTQVIIYKVDILTQPHIHKKNPTEFTLSNSSMQTTPPSARTIAPPSIMKLREAGSLMTDAVNPAALLPLPDVYTPIGETFSTNFRS